MTHNPSLRQPVDWKANAVHDWAEEAWRFLASDFSDSPDFERRQRERIVRYLGAALDGKPVPSSLEAQDR